MVLIKSQEKKEIFIILEELWDIHLVLPHVKKGGMSLPLTPEVSISLSES